MLVIHCLRTCGGLGTDSYEQTERESQKLNIMSISLASSILGGGSKRAWNKVNMNNDNEANLWEIRSSCWYRLEGICQRFSASPIHMIVLEKTSKIIRTGDFCSHKCFRGTQYCTRISLLWTFVSVPEKGEFFIMWSCSSCGDFRGLLHAPSWAPTTPAWLTSLISALF